GDPDIAGDRPDLPAAVALAARPPDVRAWSGDLPGLREEQPAPRAGEQRDRRLTAADSAGPVDVAPATVPGPAAPAGRRRFVMLLIVAAAAVLLAVVAATALGGPGRKVET